MFNCQSVVHNSQLKQSHPVKFTVLVIAMPITPILLTLEFDTTKSLFTNLAISFITVNPRSSLLTSYLNCLSLAMSTSHCQDHLLLVSFATLLITVINSSYLSLSYLIAYNPLTKSI